MKWDYSMVLECARLGEDAKDEEKLVRSEFSDVGVLNGCIHREEGRISEAAVEGGGTVVGRRLRRGFVPFLEGMTLGSGRSNPLVDVIDPVIFKGSNDGGIRRDVMEGAVVRLKESQIKIDVKGMGNFQIPLRIIPKEAPVVGHGKVIGKRRERRYRWPGSGRVKTFPILPDTLRVEHRIDTR